MSWLGELWGPLRALALGCALLLACTDTGIVGDLSGALACEPSCGEGERCDEDRGECVDDDDDCDDDDDDGCDEPACTDASCAECREDDDCDDDDEPFCVDGKCRECVENDDCDNSGDKREVCEDYECVNEDKD